MNFQEVFDQLVGIIQEDLQISIQSDIKEDTSLKELGIDSIAMMALWVYAEEKFQYETDEDALVGDQFNSIGDIANYIHQKIQD